MEKRGMCMWSAALWPWSMVGSPTAYLLRAHLINTIRLPTTVKDVVFWHVLLQWDVVQFDALKYWVVQRYTPLELGGAQWCSVTCRGPLWQPKNAQCEPGLRFRCLPSVWENPSAVTFHWIRTPRRVRTGQTPKMIHVNQQTGFFGVTCN